MNATPSSDLPDGIHDGVPARAYHALRRLSASGCKLLIEECPAIFRHQLDHPEDDRASPAAWMGTAAHVLALEPHRWSEAVSVVHAADYKAKAAQAARDEALAAGRVPLLDHQAETVVAMGRMLRAELGDLFDGGAAERTYLWTDADTGVPMKARPDHAKPRLLVDYKTTADASPRAFTRRLPDCQHHLQAALYLEAHELLTGETADWLWVVQATQAPYLVSAFRPTRAALHVGQVKARAAINLFARCTAEGRWPGYTPEPMTIDLPSYEMRSFEDREAAGEFGGLRPIRIDQALSMAAQAPHRS